jgi:predicted house-cleaning NTP pyrophosphatase (Maf/HAM1 superfamily)
LGFCRARWRIERERREEMGVRLRPIDIAVKLREMTDTQAGSYLDELAGFIRPRLDTALEPRLVLGSRSPRRHVLLKDLLRLEHERVVIDVVEELPPRRFAPDIASKCLTVQKFLGYVDEIDTVYKAGNILLVGDTIVVGEGREVLGKEPENLGSDRERYEFCRQRMIGYAGRAVKVYSSVIVADLRIRKAFIGSDSVVIEFRERSPEVEKVVEQYCSHIFDEKKVAKHRGPLGKAGSFGIQEPEVLYLVQRVEGDITVAVGLPVDVTLSILGRLPGLGVADSYSAGDFVETVLADALSEKVAGIDTDLKAHVLGLLSG